MTAYIYKPKRKPSARYKERQKLYQMKQWKALTEWFRMNHPLCQICEEKGLTTPAEHVHHIQSPFDYGLSQSEWIARLLDEDNLMCLCRDCHNEIHGNIKNNSDNIDNFSF